MGNQFYRIKELGINFAEKHQLKEKLATGANYVVKKVEKLKTKGLSRKQTIIISSLLVICLVIVLWPTKKTESPMNAVANIEQAILSGDSQQVIHLVDINAISKDMANAVVAQISSKKLTQDLLSYMQKELENKISNDFFNIINNKGDFYKNLKDNNAVLSKTLNFLVNKSGKVISREVIEETDESATIKLVIFRPDIEQEITVQLLLEHNGVDWSVTEIKDLAKLLANLEEIEEKRIEKLNNQIRENFNSYIILKDFQKSNLNIKENSFLMRLSLENISAEDIMQVEGTLKLIYKNQLMGTIGISVPETIFANNFYEKAWSIKLNDYQSLKNIAMTRSKDIKAVLDIEKIVFTKGNVIELIK